MGDLKAPKDPDTEGRPQRLDDRLASLLSLDDVQVGTRSMLVDALGAATWSKVD